MAHRESERFARTRWAVAMLSVISVLAAAASFVTGHASPALFDMGEVLLALLAAVNCALAACAASGRLRFAWGALAAASGSWAVGGTIWTWYELVAEVAVPFPGWSDFGFLGFPLAAMLALAVFPAQASREDRRRMTLDGLMAASAIALVSWDTALGAVVAAGGDSLLATVISIAYPVTDIALLVLCVLVLSRSRAHRLPLGFVAGGLILMALADSGYAYLVLQGDYASGGVVDLGWFLAFALIALAPLARGATRDLEADKGPRVAGVALPYVPLAVAAVFVGYRYVTGHRFEAVDVVIMAITLALLLLRQFLTVRDNQRLALALAAREAELRHQAFHDGLTGLANRALFVDRVAHALALHRRDGRPLAVCFIDLDGFKAVNDTLGHSAGDALLQQVSVRFTEVLSDADTLARFGGDEFAVLLEDHADALEAAAALLDRLREPFVINGRTVAVFASIGIARVDQFETSPSVDDVLVRADVAMYAVKRRGKGQVLLHTPELQFDELDDVALGHSLVRALAEGEVSVVYQPVVELPTGRLHDLEALVRWSPDGRPLAPETLIRVAERAGIVDAMFEAVLTEACRQLVRWSTLPGGEQIRVSVNASPSQLSDPDLPARVAETLSRHGISGDRLVLEITETERLADKEMCLQVCRDLRSTGVRLAIDDFGSGRTSLARLRELPIDEVKIDRVFVAGVDHDADSLRFVRGVLALAQEVGLTVIAEGVEREAERDALAALGCPRAQGYLFSRPITGPEVDALIAPTQRSGAAVPAPRDFGGVRRIARALTGD